MTPLTDSLRAILKAAIPRDIGVDEQLLADAKRWRDVLVEETDRLAGAQFPHEKVEILLQAKAAFWSESVLISGFGDDAQAKWSIRAPISRRLLPRSQFARAFAQDASAGGPHIRVPHGHRVKGLFDAWFAAGQRVRDAGVEAHGAFVVLVDAAETLEDIVEAWPDAARIVAVAPPDREAKLAAAREKVRLLLNHHAPLVNVVDTPESSE